MKPGYLLSELCSMKTTHPQTSFVHIQIPDAEFDKKLKTDSQLKDADRATILECDDTECAQVECVQDNRGNWVCEGGLEGEDRKTTKTVLMASMDDGE